MYAIIGWVWIKIHPLTVKHTSGNAAGRIQSLKYAIFKPRESERNFLFSVIMLTAKMLFFVILLIGLIGGGVVAGIAKG